MTVDAPRGTVAERRLGRLRSFLDESDLAAFVVASPANVGYATGYRSVPGSIFRTHQMAAVVDREERTLVCPAADTGPAVDAGMGEHELVAFGRFYFETSHDHVAARMADQHAGVVEGLVTAVHQHGLERARFGVDVAGLGPHWPAFEDALPDADLVDATAALSRVRARKLPEEVDLLRRAARLAEQGIDRALETVRVGDTERDVARIVASTMVEGGGDPAFIVVTSGERSALADARPTDNPVRPGDLLRFDVGCNLDGYWSDMARTAVIGAPTELQADRYAALLAGEQAQLDLVRPGVTAAELFDIAIDTVEAHGLRPYRRHHCGHGIGSDVYEPPIVAPGHDVRLEYGMTFCLETPYYELGWGGMMVEDTIVVTEDGHERFTVSDRSLRVVDA